MAHEVRVHARTEAAVDRFLARIAAAGIADDVEVDVLGTVVQLSVPFGRLDGLLPEIRAVAQDLGLSVVGEEPRKEDAIRAGRHAVEHAIDSRPDSQQALAHLAKELGGYIGPRLPEGWLDGIYGVTLPIQFADEYQSEAEKRRLLAGLASKRVTERRLAAFQSGGWPGDLEITEQLRRLAAGDQDSYVAAYAAQSLGLVGDLASSDELRRVATRLAAQLKAQGTSDVVPFLASAVGCLVLGAHRPSQAESTEGFLRDICRGLAPQVGDSVSLIAERVRSAGRHGTAH